MQQLLQVTFEEAVVDITYKQCEVHVFVFTLSIEQAQEVEAQEVEAVDRVLFHDYGMGMNDEIVSGSFQ
ncbi:MAG: hypothetical protein FRX49_08733 [Trebouxia sp. A1-2]|nr:MAG: hypothetical protein FRX49_08733 [Trebouxia sp. A1-2]